MTIIGRLRDDMGLLVFCNA